MVTNRKKILFPAVAGLLLVLTGWTLPSLLLNSDTSRQWVEQSINKQIPGTVRIKDHHLSLPGRRLELYGLSLSAAEGVPILAVDRFRTKIRLLPLLKRTIRIEQVLLENTRGRLKTGPDGILNLINAFRTEAPAASTVDKDKGAFRLFLKTIIPRKIIVASVQLNNTRLRYENDREAFEITGAAISFSGRAGLIKPSGRVVLRGQDIHLGIPGMPLTIERLDFEAALDKGDIHSLTLQADGVFGSARLTGEIRRIFSDPRMDLALKSDLHIKAIGSLPGIAHDLSGHAIIKADISGRFLSPLIHADLEIQEAVLGPAHIDRLKCRLDISDQAVTIDSLTLASGEGRATVTGRISLEEAFPRGLFGGEQYLDNLAYAFNVNVNDFDPLPLFDGLLPDDRGWEGAVLRSTLKISGRGLDPDHSTASLAGEIEVRDFKDTLTASPVSAAIGIDAEWKTATLRVNRLTGRAAGININGNGSYALRTRNLSARVKLAAAQIGQASSLLGRDEITGTLDLDAVVAGTLPDLRGEATLSSDHLAFAPVTIGKVDGRFALSRGTLEIQQLITSQGDSYCRATGTLRLWDEATGLFFRNPPLTLTIQPSTIYPADLLAGGRQGKVILSGSFSGPLLNPGGELFLRGEDLDMEILRADTLNIKATLEDDAVRVLTLEANFPDNQSIQGSGEISWDRTYQFRLTSSGAFLSLLRPVHEFGRAEGTARFDVTGHGDWWEIPRLGGTMTIDHVSLADMALADMSVAIGFDGHSAEIVVHNDAEISGMLNLSDLTFSARAKLEQTALGPLFSLADRADISGYLSAGIEAEGQLTDLKSIKAAAVIDHLTLSHHQRQWIQAAPFNLDYDEGVLNIPDVSLAVAEGGSLDFKGRIGIDHTLLLRIQGEAPMALAGIFAPDLHEITGNLLLDADVYGTLDNPGVTGRITLAGIGMSLPHIHQKLENINGVINFQPGRMALKGISGRLGTGRFAVSGTASLDGLIPTAMSFKLHAEEVPLSVPDMMDVRLDADLSMVKTDTEENIRGEVVILDGVYHRDVQLIGYADIIRAPFQRQRKRDLPPARQPPLPPFLGNISLDLSLTHRLPFKVDNNLALLEIFPDLSIGGTLNRPIIMGQARIGSGEIIFYRKPFVVEQGTVDFSNPYETEPYINMTGSTQIRQWRINLSVTGPLEQLQVELTSDPHESISSILSLLVFGQPSRDLGDQEAARKAPSQLVAELLTATFAEDIKTITGLDIVEMSARGDDPENDYGQTTITVGSRLTDRLVLKHSLESSRGELTQAISSEYRLTENTTVSGYQNDRGILGGQLIYRLEFR